MHNRARIFVDTGFYYSKLASMHIALQKAEINIYDMRQLTHFQQHALENVRCGRGRRDKSIHNIGID